MLKNFLINQIKKTHIRHNDCFIQKPTSMKCGLVCMKYITERNKNKSPKTVLKLFTEYLSDYNEKCVLHR